MKLSPFLNYRMYALLHHNINFKNEKMNNRFLTLLFIATFIILSSFNNDDDNAIEPTNTEKSVAVFQAIQSGDVTAMQDYISATTYTQHNLSYPDGVTAVIGATQSGTFTGTTINTVRTFEDDDIVVLHSEYGGTWNANVPQVVFDVFRFENGLNIEHWNNLANISDDGDGTTQLNANLTPATELDKIEANRAIVADNKS